MRSNRTEIVVNVNGKSEKRNVLILEFYEEFYKDIPVEERLEFKVFERICKTPFLHFIRKVRTGKLYEFRLKYIGKFVPSPAAIVAELSNSKKRFEKGLIPEKFYLEYKEILKDYIKEEPKLFDKWNYSSLTD